MNTPGVQCTVAVPASGAAALAQQYVATRDTTRKLCAPLTADDQMVQSTPEASPVKWHQAHTTWFFETFVLSHHLPGYRPFDPAFRSLFNSYYKQVGAHPLRTLRSVFCRPSLEQVQAYRNYVDEHISRLLAGRDVEDTPVGALIELGINHEQQHQELIVTDLKHAFWSTPLRPAYLDSPVEADNSDASSLAWRHFDGGLHEIGHRGTHFAFDNEGPSHHVYLEPFRVATRLATNSEYMEFMQDGSYRRPELWLSDGWDAVQANQWEAPLYWERTDSGWATFTLGGMRAVQPSEPVCHVSYYEADAFARWAGARLPRESEWEIAAAGIAFQGNLLEDGRFHPAPAGADGLTLAGSGRPGPALQQIFGDVWEWTQSPYIAYPGFHPAAGALGEYNGKFMCNQMVLRGGSCATPRAHIRATYRNFFPPASRWQFMGIRLASECA